LQLEGNTIEKPAQQVSAAYQLVQVGLKKRRGNPFPQMDRSISMGKLGKLVGCIVKGPIEMPEGAVNKRCLSMRDVLDNMPVRSPKGRVIDGIDHCESIAFKHNRESYNS